MERNGAVAGILLSVMFTAASFVPLCCRRRCFIVLLQLLAVACAAAGVVSFYLYKTDVLDEITFLETSGITFKFQAGVFLAGAAAGAGFIAMLGACCVQREDHDGYQLVG